MDRLAYNPSEAGKSIGVSRPTIYDLMNRAEDPLPNFKVGTRRLIPVDGLILKPVKKCKALFIAPKARQVLYETSFKRFQRLNGLCEAQPFQIKMDIFIWK